MWDAARTAIAFLRTAPRDDQASLQRIEQRIARGVRELCRCQLVGARSNFLQRKLAQGARAAQIRMAQSA